MKEYCCRFGRGRALAGIVTEPDSGDVARAMVLVSAGLLPKSGPFRLYTELARQLAGEGVATLRFDLGGLGESRQAYRGLDLRARTALEIEAAVAFLSSRYVLKGVVLAGLCSGAEDAFRAAATDERVTGVVLIDPFAYRTSGWGRRHAWHRLGRRVLRALGIYAPASAALPAAAERAVSYRYMERAESEPILRTLLARRAHVHFVYTAGARDTFNHASQFSAQFPNLALEGNVTLDHLPRLDHTQLLAADRRTLVEVVAARLREAGAPEPTLA